MYEVVFEFAGAGAGGHGTDMTWRTYVPTDSIDEALARARKILRTDAVLTNLLANYSHSVSARYMK